MTFLNVVYLLIGIVIGNFLYGIMDMLHDSAFEEKETSCKGG